MGKTIQVSGFPASATAQDVKEYLEKHTGALGPVLCVKIKEFRAGKRLHATVQFKTVEAAEHIISLCEYRMWYGTSYLRARKMDADLVPPPKTYHFNIDDATLHFGCQIADDKFSAFRRETNVSFSISFGKKKLLFCLTFRGIEYELELSYEDIWQIQLYHQRGCPSKYLLIQLFGAPRIYEKRECNSQHFFEAELRARTTDFTPSNCIGQSSAFCLEVRRDCQFSSFKENIVHYKDNDRKFTVEADGPFCVNQQLVPTIATSDGVDIPYGILFKVNLLVQSGYLAGPNLGPSFFRLIDPRRINIECIENALEKLYYLKDCCYEPVKWLEEQYRKYFTSKKPPHRPSISLDDGLVYVRRVQITPCRVYFAGPEVNVSNRVLRNYPDDIDNFLRVSFVDEDLEKVYSADLILRASSGSEGKQTGIYSRILSTLRNGITIGDKKFEFLAFSSSQVRENSLWMFASRPGLSAANIRQRMGDFRAIRNVAKYAARLGQSFSSSTETLSVGRSEIEILPDIEVTTGKIKYVFSDGIGKISAGFAEKVAAKCGIKGAIPSAFQIRYGGHKGVVAVDPLSSRKLSLRKSMCKYESSETKLDVLAYSKYQPCYLNRQLITLLSTLGVRDYVFENKQREAMNQLDAILTDPLIACEALDLMSPGENTNILKEMLGCGYKPGSEPFLSMMLQNFRTSKLLELRVKSRIFIPYGRSLMGCLDETRTLEYGQVFVQVSGSRSQNSGKDFLRAGSFSTQQFTNIITGKVVVAKNPCLHPGDVRVLKAVNVPDLHHMVDCVVFPQKGKRPHTNECSGSDLDGDIYFVSWDHDLLPPRQEEPMDYTPAEPICLDHDVTIEEVEEYFTNYIVNDNLGIISNAHTVHADREHEMAMSAPCIQLAKLFSVAVDFPKTGVPAVIPQDLYARDYPDFMEKPDKPTYESQRVIGKLFRQVKERAPQKSSIRSFTEEVARQSYDQDMEFDGFEEYLDDAFYYKTEYDFKLGNLMEYYGIQTEAEILSGNIMKMSKPFNRRRDAEAIILAVKSLRKEARSWFNKKDVVLRSEANDMYAKACAWYYVTYHPAYWGSYNEGMNRDHYISFPWCIYDKLILLKKRNINRLQISSLASDLSQQFSFH